MIESIILKNVASYNNIGASFTNLKKINFVYGANGSGKTTVTKYLNDPEHNLFTDCSITWKNNLPIKALVYNKDFKEKNFNKSNIDGIFTLGQATQEEIKEIEKKQHSLKDIKANLLQKLDNLESKSKLLNREQEIFKEKVWTDIFKEFDDDFNPAFNGFKRKELFVGRLLRELANNNSPLQLYNDLLEKAQIIFNETPINSQKLPDFDASRLLEIQNDLIWHKKIVGKADIDIASLIIKLNINDWVNEGRKYVNEDDICPFCQKHTITETFRADLEKYFDETFIDDTESVNMKATEYIRILENIINQLSDIESCEAQNIKTKLDISSFSAYLKTLISMFSNNRQLLNNKIKEPSSVIKLVSVKEQLDDIKKIVEDANKEIDKHNTLVSNYDREYNLLVESIWKFLVEENKTELQNYTSKVKGMQTSIEVLNLQILTLKGQIKALEDEIREDTKNMTSVQPSVDEINRILKSYGYSNIQIVPANLNKTQYQNQREDGTLAESTLSEGEVTFITFLYYLQLAKGSTSESTITEERILVIDDPISSLDSNILFVVSSLLKQVIKTIKAETTNIKQLILFTHNVYFHKEVSFIDGKTKHCSRTNFWVIHKKNNIATVEFYGNDNPISTSYELLWKELRISNSSNISIQNSMRRIIENYFKLLGKYGDDELIENFKTQEEREICRSLICWINDGSHSINDDLFIEHHENVIEKYLTVFKNIFKYMNHEEHYNMMMGIEKEITEQVV